MLLECTENILDLPVSNNHLEMSDFHEKDCYEMMKLKEYCLVPIYSPCVYFKYRRYLIDWCSEVGEQLLLNKLTIHSAIGYIDRLLMNEIIPPKEQLQLIALCCLYLSAKVEESESTIPRKEQFIHHSKGRYQSFHFTSMESIVLSRLNWNLIQRTPIHFIGILTIQMKWYSDDRIHGQKINSPIKEHFISYMEFFADLCIQQEEFLSYTPSILASSMIIATRKALHIEPFWRQELTMLTGYSYNQLYYCYQHIWCHFMKTFPDRKDLTHSPSSVTDFTSYHKW